MIWEYKEKSISCLNAWIEMCRWFHVWIQPKDFRNHVFSPKACGFKTKEDCHCWYSSLLWFRWESTPDLSGLFLNQVFPLFYSQAKIEWEYISFIHHMGPWNFLKPLLFDYKKQKEAQRLLHLFVVIPLGFKPRTFRTGIWRSIQLSYGTMNYCFAKV